jgi:hypothetical protein
MVEPAKRVVNAPLRRLLRCIYLFFSFTTPVMTSVRMAALEMGKLDATLLDSSAPRSRQTERPGCSFFLSIPTGFPRRNLTVAARGRQFLKQIMGSARFNSLGLFAH